MIIQEMPYVEPTGELQRSVVSSLFGKDRHPWTMMHGSFRDVRGLAIGGQPFVYKEEAIKQQFIRLSTTTKSGMKGDIRCNIYVLLNTTAAGVTRRKDTWQAKPLSLSKSEKQITAERRAEITKCVAADWKDLRSTQIARCCMVICELGVGVFCSPSCHSLF